MAGTILCLVLSIVVIRHNCWATPTPVRFVPTPIPLVWGVSGTREQRTLSTVATVPTHYWEDTLRHSVYLTLVRDKIDDWVKRTGRNKETIAVDDRDLWEKINHAPFDRVKPIELPASEVVTISSGRLLEENEGFRFSENIKGTDKCTGDGCHQKPVRALWAVKRVLQRDDPNQDGPHHYELTFSVITDPQKIIAKNNIARTFTVKESTSEDSNVKAEKIKVQESTNQNKALWFHKNIVHPEDEWAAVGVTSYEPERSKITGETFGETARMFTDIFDDDEDDKRRQPKKLPPNWRHPQYSKVQVPIDFNQQNKLSAYPYKPHVKHSRPPIPVPQSQHHYLDFDGIGVVSNPYVPQDNKVSPSKTKSAIANVTYSQQPLLLPQHKQPLQHPGKQPLSQQIKPITLQSVPIQIKNSSRHPGPPREALSYPVKEKPIAVKYSYAKQTIRPPVYQSQQGMYSEKKPFKPMPPTKQQHLPRPNRPIDFKPSPQLLDIQFSDPDPVDFRPMNVHFLFNNTNSNESETADSKFESTNLNVDAQKRVTTTEEPEIITVDPEKMRKIRKTTTTTSTTTTSTTTAAPMTTTALEIVTAAEDLSWTNILGAFIDTSKNKPATTTETYTETTNVDDYTPFSIETEPSTAKATTTTTEAIKTTEKTENEDFTPTTTTPKPTRPKRKTKKRLTSTTPKIEKEILITEASIAAAVITRNEVTHKPRITYTDYSTASSEIKYQKSDETSESKEEPTVKSKNRYRQSAVMVKGTSIKHDKWSQSATPETTKPLPKPSALVTNKHQTRRTESNFQGYNTTPNPHNYEVVENVSEEPTSTEYYRPTSKSEYGGKDSEAEPSYSIPSDSFQKQKEITKAKFETTSKLRPNVISLKNYKTKKTEATTVSSGESIEESTTVAPPPRVTPKKVCKKKKLSTSTTTIEPEELELNVTKESAEEKTPITENYDEEIEDNDDSDTFNLEKILGVSDENIMSEQAKSERTVVDKKFDEFRETENDKEEQYEDEDEEDEEEFSEEESKKNEKFVKFDNKTETINFFDFFTENLDEKSEGKDDQRAIPEEYPAEEPIYNDFGENGFLDFMGME